MEYAVIYHSICTGNGINTLDEDCDDGNSGTHDGCLNSCKVEPG